MTPLQLLDRLASLATPPRVHKHRYRGVLAPHANLRKAVTETACPGIDQTVGRDDSWE